MIEFMMLHKDLWFIPFNICGILLNMWDKRACFLFWFPTNFIFTYFSLERENYSMVVMQLIYGCMNIWGVWKWRHKPWFAKEKKHV